MTSTRNTTVPVPVPMHSPDNKVLVCGTSPPRENKQLKSMLVFFDVSTIISATTTSTSSVEPQQKQQQQPCLQIAVVAGGSAIYIQWVKKTNQIFVT